MRCDHAKPNFPKWLLKCEGINFTCRVCFSKDIKKSLEPTDAVVKKISKKVQQQINVEKAATRIISTSRQDLRETETFEI